MSPGAQPPHNEGNPASKRPERGTGLQREAETVHESITTLIRVDAAFDPFYYGYYIVGLRPLASAHGILFSARGFEPAFGHGLAFVTGHEVKRRVFIDARDGPEIDHVLLRWCDVYGKVNPDRAVLAIEGGSKVVAIGPSFGIMVWHLLPGLFLAVANYGRVGRRVSSRREHFANYWRQATYRLPLAKYDPAPSEANYVFAMGSLWKGEPETNRLRANFFEACRSIRALTFEGGFAPRVKADVPGFSRHTVSSRYPIAEYVARTKRSAVVFNTPAVGGCHGWKLAEFLALGKAIISTPLVRELPGPLVDGEHVHVTDGSVGSLREAIERICKDQAYRSRLENGARHYYDEYLAPARVIVRLLSAKT